MKTVANFKTVKANFYVGKFLSTEKVPYCGQINIWGILDDAGHIVDYEGDTGGEFERDFQAVWTISGYMVTWVRIRL